MWLSVGLTLVMATGSLGALGTPAETPESDEEEIDVVGYLDVTRSGAAIEIPRIPYIGRIGTRLELFQENKFFYIAKVRTVEHGEQLAAFNKTSPQGIGNAWVTAEKLLIFGTETESVPGYFYLERGEEIPVLEEWDGAYVAAITRHGYRTTLSIPRDLNGIRFKPPFEKRVQVAKRTVQKVRSFELTEAGPVLKREAIIDPDGVLLSSNQQRRTRVLEAQGRTVTVLSPDMLEDTSSRDRDPSSQDTGEEEEPQEPTKEKLFSEEADSSWFSSVVAKVLLWWDEITTKKAPVAGEDESQELAEAESPQDTGSTPADQTVMLDKAEDKPVSEVPTDGQIRETAQKMPQKEGAVTAAEEPGESEETARIRKEDQEAEEALERIEQKQKKQMQKAQTAERLPGQDETPAISMGFLSDNKLLLSVILLLAVAILVLLLLRLQKQTSRLKNTSTQIETYFSVGESDAGGANYFEDLAQDSGDFSGSLSGFSIIELINFLNSGKETGTLSVKDEAGTTAGRLYFSGGQLIDASYKKIRGQDAVFAMLKSQEATFTFNRSQEQKRKKTIETPTMSLLLEASKQIDEEKSAR